MIHLSLAIITFLIPGVTSDVTCITGTVPVGNSVVGFVRCDFGRNVGQGTHQFSVVYCGSDVCRSETQTYPLACKTNDGKVECTPLLSGYTFDGQVDIILTLGITNLTEQTAGAYKCQVLTGDPSPSHTCNLTHTLTDKPSSEGRATAQETTEGGFPASSVALLVVLLVVLVVFGLLLIAFIRYKKSRRQALTRPPVHIGVGEYTIPTETTNSGVGDYIVTMDVDVQATMQLDTTTRGVGGDVITTMDEAVQATMKPLTTDRGTHMGTERITADKHTNTVTEFKSPASPVDKYGKALPFSPLAVVNRQPKYRRQHRSSPQHVCRIHQQPSWCKPANPPPAGHLSHTQSVPQPKRPTTDRTDGQRSLQSFSGSRGVDEEHQHSDDDDEDHHRNLNENKKEESTRLMAGARNRPDKIDTSAQEKPDDDTNPVSPLMREQPARVNTTEFQTWGNDDVCEWLKQVGLERWVGQFQDKNITGQNLVRPGWWSTYRPISQSDLKEMGITAKNDQDAVQKAIAAMLTNA